ncbi:hypothetical protein [Pseudohongiella sp.]|uniref:Uncharacterized protein n=1 Tax=marine sediment metagenome TaxID=412755 RepID=A0A0F9WJL3_9ZZZZ|nr:hypothetical protein [Pseudohongiella sp.]HDZ08172.1 hypothetical protein [Pseudohongiella sp.]HEA63140.1 hypothetical protein [Pseudohongiella sp.]
MIKARQHVAKYTLLGLSLAMASTLSAQDAERPDLSGLWTNASLTSLNRPQGVDQLVVTPEEAQMIVANTSVAGLPIDEVDAADSSSGEAPPAGSFDFGLRGYNDFWIDPGSNLALVKGEFRTSYVIDPENGRVPRLETPKVEIARSFGARYVTGQGNADGPEALPLSERCFIGFGNTAGPGMMGTLYNSTYQFVQTDDYFTILVEMNHDARIIPLYDSAEEARANARPTELNQWFGDSRGWYEDGWLVVETININPLQIAESSVPITADGVITERFMRHSDTEIVYQFTVDDDNLYSQPWTAELSYHATEGPMYEYACHEGNYAMPGILAGARRAEAEAAGEL